MTDEIQLINDGDGIAIIGNNSAVERLLTSTGLASQDLGLPRLRRVLSVGGTASQTGAEVAAQSGRWVKLTEESAQALKVSRAMSGSTAGVNRAVLTDNGKISKILEFTTEGALSNPAVLAGAAGIMAQLAMQQTMNEITDYLATIDQKVDDVLRAQKDSTLADMIGVAYVIDEAMAVRDRVGHVSEVTWSKVQATTFTIARTQAYALRQLDGYAEKLEGDARVGDLAKAAKETDATVHEWLAVLARCFQLQDAICVLELDRVLDSTPDDLEKHRAALQAARDNRRQAIAKSAMHLITRLDAAAGFANSKVLLHPASSREVVTASNHVASAVIDFKERLGIEHGREELEARRWKEAATEVRDRTWERGSARVAAARRFGSEHLDQARSAPSRLSQKAGERPFRRRKDPGDEG